MLTMLKREHASMSDSVRGQSLRALQTPMMKQNMSSSDSFGSIDEEILKELKKVPAVLATQDELDLVEVVKGLRHRLKVLPPLASLCLGLFHFTSQTSHSHRGEVPRQYSALKRQKYSMGRILRILWSSTGKTAKLS